MCAVRGLGPQTGQSLGPGSSGNHRGLSPRQSSVLFVLPPVSGPVVVTSALTQGKLTHIEVAVLAQGHRVEKQSKDPGHLSLDGANNTEPATVP